MKIEHESEYPTVFLSDYKKPSHMTPDISLHFELFDDYTIVTGLYKVKKQKDNIEEKDFCLNGDNQEILEIKIDNMPLNHSQYQVDEQTKTLSCYNVPDEFEFEIKVKIHPDKNLTCEGLYQTGGLYSTQNEPEGMRRIIYFVDRPDNMCLFKTRISGNKKNYPFLLSNGNKLEEGVDLQDSNRHFALWEDPFPKPCYLFALVAGDLERLDDSFTTKSGRDIKLSIFTDKGSDVVKTCTFAMEALKRSMKWDEDVYGLEYDLDNFMIVAVDAFNFGAMENKGLNIFNSICIMASKDRSTDREFHRIEGIIAHEYFHNWTGNRVTCRDWFQLTLKEGLTVFRDQSYSADKTSASFQRIQDIQALKRSQFAEDAGPMSHPIRPTSYIQINNFYTATVYNKGAEVIRLYHTILGPENFRKGMDDYFASYDGQAVTTDDFFTSMKKYSPIPLEGLQSWYTQKGTPHLRVEYDRKVSANSGAKLIVTQVLANDQKPYLIPLKIAILDKKTGTTIMNEKLIMIEQMSQEFSFPEISESEIICSLNRNFSAPIILDSNHTEEEELFLLQHDTDEYNQYEAAQLLFQAHITAIIKNEKKSNESKKQLFHVLGELFSKLEMTSPLFLSQLLSLPDDFNLLSQQQEMNFIKTGLSKDEFSKEISKNLKDKFSSCYLRLQNKDELEMSERALKNCCLIYLGKLDEDEQKTLALNQYQNSSLMDDKYFALQALNSSRSHERQQAMDDFYKNWCDDPNMILKWFALISSAHHPEALDDIKRTLQDKSFKENIPNHTSSLIGPFIQNLSQFYKEDGASFEFITEKILYFNERNPSTAASLAKGFQYYQKSSQEIRNKMKGCIEKILATPKLSTNVYELVYKYYKG